MNHSGHITVQYRYDAPWTTQGPCHSTVQGGGTMNHSGHITVQYREEAPWTTQGPCHSTVQGGGPMDHSGTLTQYSTGRRLRGHITVQYKSIAWRMHGRDTSRR